MQKKLIGKVYQEHNFGRRYTVSCQGTVGVELERDGERKTVTYEILERSYTEINKDYE
jgi:hypothetical protein